MTDTRPQGTRDEVVVECELDAPPEKVWRALTEPALVEAWLGGTDEAPGGPVERETLEADPPNRLSLGWRTGDSFDSRVTFELEPRPDGRTALRIVHGGFRPVASAPVVARATANTNAPAALRMAA